MESRERYKRETGKPCQRIRHDGKKDHFYSGYVHWLEEKYEKLWIITLFKGGYSRRMLAKKFKKSVAEIEEIIRYFLYGPKKNDGK